LGDQIYNKTLKDAEKSSSPKYSELDFAQDVVNITEKMGDNVVEMPVLKALINS
jgi:hypothetical protein